MLKKKFRLNPKNRLSKPYFFKSRFFNVKYSGNALSLNRFAFIVSKKIDKRATVRNRLKRVFRSCIEEVFEDIKTGNDFLFILKKEALEKEKKELYEEILGFLEKEKLISINLN